MILLIIKHVSIQGDTYVTVEDLNNVWYCGVEYLFALGGLVDFHLLQDVLNPRVLSVNQPETRHIGVIMPVVVQVNRLKVLVKYT